MNKHYENWYSGSYCDICGHFGTTKEYGVMFDYGMDWADSLSESYCLKCLTKMQAKRLYYKAMSLLDFVKFYFDIFDGVKWSKRKSIAWTYRLFKSYKGGR